MKGLARMTAWMDEDGVFLCARHLESLPAFEPQCVVLGHENTRVWDVYCVRPPSVTVHLIGCKRSPTATTKKWKQIRWIRNVKRVSDYELYMACENSVKKRVTPFVVALLSMFDHKNFGSRTKWNSSYHAKIFTMLYESVVIPVPFITLAPWWRRRRPWPEFPSRLWINFGALNDMSSVLILRWNRLLVIFWLSVQVTFQRDCGFVIISKSHWSIECWILQL